MADREEAVIQDLELVHEYIRKEVHDIASRKCRMMDKVNDALALLKEQEPKTGHWIFESQHYEAWSHTCSECGKRMTTCIGTYASYCWNCGAKMTGVEEDA